MDKQKHITTKHCDDCKCRKCEAAYSEWLRLNTCDVCDDLLDDYGICEYCAEKDMQNDRNTRNEDS